MSRAEVDDAPASKEPPHAPGHLPRLVELLARQALRAAHRTREAVEKRVTGKTTEVMTRQARV